MPFATETIIIILNSLSCCQFMRQNPCVTSVVANATTYTLAAFYKSLGFTTTYYLHNYWMSLIFDVYLTHDFGAINITFFFLLIKMEQRRVWSNFLQYKLPELKNKTEIIIIVTTSHHRAEIRKWYCSHPQKSISSTYSWHGAERSTKLLAGLVQVLPWSPSFVSYYRWVRCNLL